MSINAAFWSMHYDEGGAIEEAQKIQSALETCAEIGSPEECAAANLLLGRINTTLVELTTPHTFEINGVVMTCSRKMPCPLHQN